MSGGAVTLHMNHKTHRVRVVHNGRTLARVDNLENHGPWVVGYVRDRVVLILRRVSTRRV